MTASCFKARFLDVVEYEQKTELLCLSFEFDVFVQCRGTAAKNDTTNGFLCDFWLSQNFSKGLLGFIFHIIMRTLRLMVPIISHLTAAYGCNTFSNGCVLAVSF